VFIGVLCRWSVCFLVSWIELLCFGGVGGVDEGMCLVGRVERGVC